MPGREVISITGAGSNLQGVGHASDGRAVFVPGALPGERALVEFTRDGGRFYEARLLEVVAPAPGRAPSACKYYPRCGGCAARHMDYETTLALKRGRVADALFRLGGAGDVRVLDTLASPLRERYRNKAEYACETRQGALVAGMRARGGREIIPVKDCLLQHEHSGAFARVAAALIPPALRPDVAGLVTRVNAAGELMGVVTARRMIRPAEAAALWRALSGELAFLTSLNWCALGPRPAHALDGRIVCIGGEERLNEAVGGVDYALSPRSFFQVNRAQAERLVEQAVRAAALTGNERVADCYCGIGTLTLPFARAARQATGIEIVPEAIADARLAAQKSGLDARARFIAGDAPDCLRRLVERGEAFDLIVVDPPRKGVDARLIQSIGRVRPRAVVYVSCDPATLARDVGRLAQQGYAPLWAQPIDMFPWTEHVETVVLLSQQKPDGGL